MPTPREIFERLKFGKTVAQARKDVNTNPTPAQAAAGNYALGRCELHGIPISIENPRNSVRKGVDPDGTPWESDMIWDYGYFTGTKAVDGDAIDVFIGPNHKSELVFAVDQLAGKKFDETKFLMGFDSRKDAIKGYLDHYPKGWKLGEVSSCTIEQLKTWLKDGAHKREFGGQQLKAAADSPLTFKEWVAAARGENPLYDWDGTIIPRLPGGMKEYLGQLKGLTENDVSPLVRGRGKLDIATARPPLFHRSIRETAERLGLEIGDIHHAEGDKSEFVARHGRPLVDDDPDILAAVRARMGNDFGIEHQHEKAAADMVRKKRIVETTDDHCPHCDHKFTEKGYPRRKFKEGETDEERNAIFMSGDYDEHCPNCDGIVDSPELSDDEIDRFTFMGLGDDARKRREVKRRRKAERAKSASKEEHPYGYKCAVCEGKIVNRNRGQQPRFHCENGHVCDDGIDAVTGELRIYDGAMRLGGGVIHVADVEEPRCEHGVKVPYNTCDQGCKSAGDKFQKALNESNLPRDVTFFTDGADRCTICYGDWHGEEVEEAGNAFAREHFKNFEEADDTEIGRPEWATKSYHSNGESTMDKYAADAKPSKGCLMLSLPEGIAKRIRAFGKKNIPDEECAGDGREDYVHTTALYGFDGDTTVEEVADVLFEHLQLDAI